MRENVLSDARIFLVNIPCMRKESSSFYDCIVGPEVTVGMIWANSHMLCNWTPIKTVQGNRGLEDLCILYIQA